MNDKNISNNDYILLMENIFKNNSKFCASRHNGYNCNSPTFNKKMGYAFDSCRHYM